MGRSLTFSSRRSCFSKLAACTFILLQTRVGCTFCGYLSWPEFPQPVLSRQQITRLAPIWPTVCEKTAWPALDRLETTANWLLVESDMFKNQTVQRTWQWEVKINQLQLCHQGCPWRLWGFIAFGGDTPINKQRLIHLGSKLQRQASHNQNPLLKWSTQNHASRNKKADIRSYLLLGLSLTNLSYTRVLRPRLSKVWQSNRLHACSSSHRSSRRPLSSPLAPLSLKGA